MSSDDFDASIRETYLVGLCFLVTAVCALRFLWASQFSLDTDDTPLLSGVCVTAALGWGLFALLTSPPLCMLALSCNVGALVNQARLVGLVFRASTLASQVSLLIALPFAFLYNQAPSRSLLARIAVAAVEEALLLLLVFVSLVVFTRLASLQRELPPNPLPSLLSAPGLLLYLYYAPLGLERARQTVHAVRSPGASRRLRDELECLQLDLMAAKTREARARKQVEIAALQRTLQIRGKSRWAATLAAALLSGTLVGCVSRPVVQRALHTFWFHDWLFLPDLLLHLTLNATTALELHRRSGGGGSSSSSSNNNNDNARSKGEADMFGFIAGVLCLGLASPLVAFMLGAGPDGLMQAIERSHANVVFVYQPWPALFDLALAMRLGASVLPARR
jgi:hypothetical protein